MNSTEKPTSSWFDKMEGYLDWKIVGPNIHNPYERTFSTRMIAQLAFDRALLKQLLLIRCLCDGFEVMVIENLSAPTIITDHPCVNALGKAAIMEYLQANGFAEEIESEIDRIQAEMREELAKRDKLEMAQEQAKKQAEVKDRKAQRKKGTGDLPAASGQEYRIIKK